MKSKNLNEAAFQFSYEDLPPDYAYRYTLRHILMEKMGKTARLEMIEKLMEKLNITKRALEFYIYAKKDSKLNIMSEEYLDITAGVLGIDVAYLFAFPNDIKKAS